MSEVETRTEWGVKAKGSSGVTFGGNIYPEMIRRRAEERRDRQAERYPDIEWVVVSRTVYTTPWEEDL